MSANDVCLGDKEIEGDWNKMELIRRLRTFR